MSVNCHDNNYLRLRRKSPKTVTVSARKERNLSIKKVSHILQKDENERTKEEKDVLCNYSEVVNEATLRLERRQKLKQRLEEVEDNKSVLEEKCKVLAEAIKKSKYLVVYTGAGISTSARIPDYRGTSGIWTLMQQGKDIGTHDLTQADPTFTHMALSRLYYLGKLKHVVSQNCDGLHLRSGLPRRALSEVHGNMYIEVCKSCRPFIEYLRLFDVTEYTGRFSHKTMRRCYRCGAALVDCIVHFGERGSLPWPLNWKGASRAAEKADAILCIGSSLKVLKRYPWLWSMDKPAKRRPQLYIVNLQWTPKDCQATVKINGKCDDVMKKLMECLSIEVKEYERVKDPIFSHATELCKEERHTTDRPVLSLVKELKEEDEAVGSVLKRVRKTNTPEEKIKAVDTGQKEEYIVITIKAEADTDCCEEYDGEKRHNQSCSNFIDEKDDIPIIIEGYNDVAEAARRDVEPHKFSIDRILSSECSKTEPIASNGFLGSQSTSVLPTNPYSSFLTDYFPLYNPWFPNFLATSTLSPNLGFVLPILTLPNYDSTQIKRDCEKIDKSDVTKKLKTECDRTKCNEIGDKNKHQSMCSFCESEYSSSTCLFYMKKECLFSPDVTVCECCSDDNEVDEKTTEDEDKMTEDEEKTNEMQKSVNPGWYGKGYRKHGRKKR